MSPTDPELLVRRLLTGADDAVDALVDAARASNDPTVLVAASLYAPDGDALVARARDAAATTRDRQLVAIAAAHRRGDRDLVDALARDHLVDHPDSVVVAWIAATSHRQSLSDPTPTKEAP